MSTSMQTRHGVPTPSQIQFKWNLAESSWLMKSVSSYCPLPVTQLCLLEYSCPSKQINWLVARSQDTKPALVKSFLISCSSTIKASAFPHSQWAWEDFPICLKPKAGKKNVSSVDSEGQRICVWGVWVWCVCVFVCARARTCRRALVCACVYTHWLAVYSLLTEASCGWVISLALFRALYACAMLTLLRGLGSSPNSTHPTKQLVLWSFPSEIIWSFPYHIFLTNSYGMHHTCMFLLWLPQIISRLQSCLVWQVRAPWANLNLNETELKIQFLNLPGHILSVQWLLVMSNGTLVSRDEGCQSLKGIFVHTSNIYTQSIFLCILPKVLKKFRRYLLRTYR